MIFIKIVNNKAAVTTETDSLMLPEGKYISAVCVDNEIRFYGGETEDDVLNTGKTLNPEIETLAQAKSTIDSMGCRFYNGVLTTN
jgi:hypothetical protein